MLAAQQGTESEEGFADGYGSDLMGDEADRGRLGAMTELERELILAERAEARDTERERARNARLARQAQAASQKARCRRRRCCC